MTDRTWKRRIGLAFVRLLVRLGLLKRHDRPDDEPPEAP